jgi:nitrogen regulatory protein PII-like uncharacterized protein
VKPTVCTIYRHLSGKNGTAIMVPMKVFSKEEDAKSACSALTDLFRAMSQGVIVVDGKPVTKVENFIAEIGVSKVEFSYFRGEVNDSLLVEPRPSIIIPR